MPARGITHTQVALEPLSPFAATLERQIQLEGTLHCPLEEAQRSLSGEGERPDEEALWREGEGAAEEV